MKFDRKTHLTERQLRDLSGLTLDAIRVRSKTDPDFPELLFVDNKKQMVYDKDKALAWISNIDQPQALQVVPARELKPLAQQGEYKPSAGMIINMKRTAKVYQHGFITPDGVGNNHRNLDY